MSETKAAYLTAERETLAAAEAIRAEAQQVKGMADWLLGVIQDMNSPAIDACTWRCAVQQVYSRLPEVIGGCE